MNGNSLFLDTNIVLYFLNGDRTLIPVLEEKVLYVSFITDLELLSYSGITSEDSRKIKSFINNCTVVEMNSGIKHDVISTRKKYNLKLPDAIIVGSAMRLDIPLISADKGMKKVNEIDFIHYEVSD